MNFRQYIPVKASGISNPDPATYCPANGYVLADPDGSWTAPVATPDPVTEEIILLCEGGSDESYLRLNIRDGFNRYFHVDVYDGSETLIHSQDYTSQDFEYTFPITTETEYYTVRITPQSGYHITKFNVYEGNSYYYLNMKILQAKFNVPYIQDLSVALQRIDYLKEALFFADMPSLVNLAYFAQYSAIEKFVFPIYSLSAVTSIRAMFKGSRIKTIDFNNIQLPSLTSMEELCQYAVDLTYFKNVNLGSMPLSSIKYMMNGVHNLKSIDLSGITVTSSILYCRYAFSDFYGTEVKFFNTNQTPLEVDCDYTFQAPLLQKLTLYGNLKLTHYYFMHSGTTNMKEYIAAPDMECTYMYCFSYSNGGLEKLTLPANTLKGGYAFQEGFPKLKEIINTPTCDTSLYVISISSPYLPSFNVPTMRAKSVYIGTTGGILTSVNLDWSNSFTHTYTSGSLLIKLYGQLSAAAIDAIFTALPTIVVSAKIDVRYNPGYASCTPSIATAKGWTVY